MSTTGTIDGTIPQIAETEHEQVIDLRDRKSGREVILHICTRYVRGGSEQRLRDIVEALPDYDHQVLLGRDSNESLLRSHLPGVEVRREVNLRRAVNPVRDAVAAGQHHPRRPCGSLRRHRHPPVEGRGDRPARGALPRTVSRSCTPCPWPTSGRGTARSRASCSARSSGDLASSTTAYVVAGADLAQRFQRLGVPSDKLRIVRSGAAPAVTGR